MRIRVFKKRDEITMAGVPRQRGRGGLEELIQSSVALGNSHLQPWHVCRIR